MENSLTPPNNVEAEAIVIGTVLRVPRAIKNVLGILSPEMFYSDLDGQIYRAAVNLYQQGKPSDVENIYWHFHERNMLLNIPDFKSLLESRFLAYPSPNIDFYAKDIAKKYKQRQYQELCLQAVAWFQEDLDSSKDLFEQGLINLRRSQDTATMRAMSGVIQDAYDSCSEAYVKKHDGIDSRIDNLPTGFDDLDDILDGGIPRQRLVYIHGSSGMGKTTIALQIAKYCAVDVGLPTLFFSLEMSAESQAFKLISSNCDISLGTIASVDFPDSKFGEIVNMISDYKNNNYKFFVDDRTRSISEICLKARQFHSKFGSVGMILIDYLTLIKTEDKGFGNRTQQVENICLELNQLKKDLDTRIVVISQIGRAVKERNDKRPKIEDGKESGAIEETADLMIGCYRDEYYYPDTLDRGMFEAIVLKNRYGKTGTAKLLWEGKYSRLKNIGRAKNW